MRILSTSVVIGFEGSASKKDELFSAEVDSREDGYNGGKTSFYKGDAPVVLLFSTYGVALNRIVQSEGANVYLGEGTFTVEESLVFANTRSEKLDKPYLSNMEIVGSMPAIGSWQVSGNELLLPNNVVAVVNVRYTSWFRAYRITNTSGDYPVVVYFEGVIA